MNTPHRGNGNGSGFFGLVDPRLSSGAGGGGLGWSPSSLGERHRPSDVFQPASSPVLLLSQRRDLNESPYKTSPHAVQDISESHHHPFSPVTSGPPPVEVVAKQLFLDSTATSRPSTTSSGTPPPPDALPSFSPPPSPTTTTTTIANTITANHPSTTPTAIEEPATRRSRQAARAANEAAASRKGTPPPPPPAHSSAAFTVPSCGLASGAAQTETGAVGVVVSTSVAGRGTCCPSSSRPSIQPNWSLTTASWPVDDVDNDSDDMDKDDHSSPYHRIPSSASVAAPLPPSGAFTQPSLRQHDSSSHWRRHTAGMEHQEHAHTQPAKWPERETFSTSLYGGGAMTAVETADDRERMNASLSLSFSLSRLRQTSLIEVEEGADDVTAEDYYDDTTDPPQRLSRHIPLRDGVDLSMAAYHLIQPSASDTRRCFTPPPPSSSMRTAATTAVPLLGSSVVSSSSSSSFPPAASTAGFGLDPPSSQTNTLFHGAYAMVGSQGVGSPLAAGSPASLYSFTDSMVSDDSSVMASLYRERLAGQLSGVITEEDGGAWRSGASEEVRPAISGLRPSPSSPPSSVLRRAPSSSVVGGSGVGGSAAALSLAHGEVLQFRPLASPVSTVTASSTSATTLSASGGALVPPTTEMISETHALERRRTTMTTTTTTANPPSVDSSSTSQRDTHPRDAHAVAMTTRATPRRYASAPRSRGTAAAATLVGGRAFRMTSGGLLLGGSRTRVEAALPSSAAETFHFRRGSMPEASSSARAAAVSAAAARDTAAAAAGVCRRHLNVHPIRVLEAPSFPKRSSQLLDWGCHNQLAIGLGHMLYLWNGETGKATKLVEQKPLESVERVLWVQRSSYVAVASSSGTTRVYDGERGSFLRALGGGAAPSSSSSSSSSIRRPAVFPGAGVTEGVTALAVRGPMLAVASDSLNGVARVYDLRAKEALVYTFLGHMGRVTSLAYSPMEPYYLATGGEDGSVLVWDGRRGTSPRAAFSRVHTGTVTALQWNPCRSRRLLSGGQDGVLCHLDLHGARHLADAEEESQNEEAGVAFTPSSLVTRAHQTGYPITGLLWQPAGEEIVTAHSTKGHLQLRHADTLQYLGAFSAVDNTADLSCMTLSPNKEHVCAAQADDTLKMWHVFSSATSKKTRSGQRSLKAEDSYYDQKA